jgi:hypothetical protein
MRRANRSPVLSRSSRRLQENPTSQRLPLMRCRWVVRSVVVASLTVLCGSVVVTYIPAPPATAVELSPDEQQIANSLPAGFPASLCSTANNPPAPFDAVASLDCSAQTGPDGPTVGRFTLWPDLDTMSGAILGQANAGPRYAPTPCPGSNTPLANWSYIATPDRVAGQILCGTFQDPPNVEWTLNSQLLTLDVSGGPDINSAYLWWTKFGNSAGPLAPGNGPDVSVGTVV